MYLNKYYGMKTGYSCLNILGVCGELYGLRKLIAQISKSDGNLIYI
jgi:hypothetical protein